MYPDLISVHKIFYAIGQGGFFSEVLEYEKQRIVIVYDCGSVESGNRIKEEIKNFPYKTIDFLVISHLDRDHYNEISELKKNRTVKHIILPKINPIDRLLFFCNKNKEDVKAFFNLVNEDGITYINNDHNEEDGRVIPLSDEERLSENINHKNSIGVISSLYNEKIPLWILKFYVDLAQYKDDSGSSFLTKDDETVINSITKVEDLTKEKIDSLKDIYKKLPDKINGSSLAMVSAPNAEYYRFYYDDVYYNRAKNYATWMNGDIVLKDIAQVNAIVEHYKEFHFFNFDYQLQHHGSRKNFYRVITEFGKMEIYVYYGYNNSHGHPNGTVIRKIKDTNVKVHDLTEFDKNINRDFIWRFFI